jgi:hypothetical protein
MSRQGEIDDLVDQLLHTGRSIVEYMRDMYHESDELRMDAEDLWTECQELHTQYIETDYYDVERVRAFNIRIEAYHLQSIALEEKVRKRLNE